MIPERVMKELRYIEVATGRKIRNQRVGTYQSRHLRAGLLNRSISLPTPGMAARCGVAKVLA